MPELFGLELAQVDGTALLVASGDIDLATSPILREALQGLHGRVTVDLSRVRFLDSSGLGVFAGQRKRLVAADGELILRNPDGIVRRAIEAVGLADWIEDN